MSNFERDEARRTYNRTAFWSCLICALLIGGGLLWVKANEEPPLTEQIYPGTNPCETFPGDPPPPESMGCDK